MQLSAAGTHPDASEQKNAHIGVVAISRRDTIIIAMLVNIALLFVLFASAVKSHDPLQESIVVDSVIKKEIVARPVDIGFISAPQPVKKASSSPVDEIDEILQQYAMKQQKMHSQVPVKEQSPPKVPASVEIKKAQEFSEVKVKNGDSLGKIAKLHGVSVEQITALNGLMTTKLRIGQVLRIPPADTKAKKEETLVAESVDASAQYYVIKSGDNPWTIARKFHLKFEDLLILNNLNEEKARNLKIGQKIRIR